MDGILLLTATAFIILGLLQIILLFKLWGMTNDVARIKEMLESRLAQSEASQQNEPSDDPNTIRIGSLVVNVKNRKQMRVKSINGDTYECDMDGGMNHGTFKREEIELFDVFYKK